MKRTGRVLKKMMVPKMVIKVVMFLEMLFISIFNKFFWLFSCIWMFLGLIKKIIIMLDKMFRVIKIMANLVLNICFKKVYVNNKDVYFVTLNSLVISFL